MSRLRPASIFFLVFSLLTAAGTWFFLVPRVDQSSLLEAQIQATRQDVSRPISLPLASSAKQAFQADSQQAVQLLPAADGQYDLITSVETAIRNQGLPLNGLTAALVDAPTALPAGSASGIKAISLIITTAGTYADIEGALTKLTTLSRYLSVSQVSLSLSGNKDHPLSVQIVASAYYLPKSK